MRPPQFGLPRLVRRTSAPHLVLNVLIAFGATVLIVRLYLELTGYPRLGNATLHVAHMLYGGITLAAACLLMLVFASPSAIRIGTVLTGVGLGLFFDEVGKFITANNDYFYRPAAPIIYLVALGIALLFMLLRRRQLKPTDAELMVEALENAEALLEGRQTEQHHERIDLNLDKIVRNMSDPDHVKLAMALREFADSEAVRPGQSRFERVVGRLEQMAQHFFLQHQKLITYALLVLLALNSLSSLVTYTVALALPIVAPGLAHVIQALYNFTGLRAWSPFLLSIDNVDLALGLVTSLITLLGIIFFVTQRRQHGLFWVQVALLLQLCVVNVFTFYVEQFSAAVLTLANLFVLLCVRAYEHQLKQAVAVGKQLTNMAPALPPGDPGPAPGALNRTSP